MLSSPEASGKVLQQHRVPWARGRAAGVDEATRAAGGDLIKLWLVGRSGQGGFNKYILYSIYNVRRVMRAAS